MIDPAVYHATDLARWTLPRAAPNRRSEDARPTKKGYLAKLRDQFLVHRAKKQTFKIVGLAERALTRPRLRRSKARRDDLVQRSEGLGCRGDADSKKCLHCHRFPPHPPASSP